MGLSDDVDAALPYLREQAQGMMNDTCQIGTITRTGAIDEATGLRPETFTVTYDGPCQFKVGDTQVQAADAADQILAVQNSFVKLPVATDPRIVTGSSASVTKNMVVRVTSSRTDAALPGTEARILGPFRGDYTSARRFPVEVVS